MPNLDYKLTYRKNLPHIQPAGATLFVTCRLAGSLPKIVLETLREEAEREEKEILKSLPKSDHTRLLDRARRRAFGRLDTVLDVAETGPTWLERPEVALIVMDSLQFLNEKSYDLDVFCIMSNHMHIVFTPLLGDDGEFIAQQRIMHSLKRYTAREANKVLGRTGQFWVHESFDHFVRDEVELNRIQRYVLNNPVKAGLVDDAQEWPFSWATWW